jgi:hypothetical protein
MKFHAPSFLLGVGVAAAAMGTRERLRPVLVELSAFGVHVWRTGRGLVSRQREHVEDLWAEIDLRARERAKASPAREASKQAAFVNGSGAAH